MQPLIGKDTLMRQSISTSVIRSRLSVKIMEHVLCDEKWDFLLIKTVSWKSGRGLSKKSHALIEKSICVDGPLGNQTVNIPTLTNKPAHLMSSGVY